MGKKEDKKPRPKLFRIIIFLALVGGVVYWLSTQVSLGTADDIGDKEGQVRGEEVEKATDIEIINEEINRVLPEVVKKQIEKINQRFYLQGEEVIRDTEKVIRETKVAEEIEKIIVETTEEVEGFPDKQKQDIKREAIKQVCDTLLKEVEDEPNQE
jgi:ribosome-binding ATPase YchF (GTP1/OBG family)